VSLLSELHGAAEHRLSRKVPPSSRSAWYRPEKEADVHELGPKGALIQYGGWFYLSGELLFAGERLTDGGPGLEYFFREAHRPQALPDLGEEVLALEFSTKLPWVLPGQPEWL
jgi:hypothetical protein